MLRKAGVVTRDYGALTMQGHEMNEAGYGYVLPAFIQGFEHIYQKKVNSLVSATFTNRCMTRTRQC